MPLAVRARAALPLAILLAAACNGRAPITSAAPPRAPAVVVPRPSAEPAAELPQDDPNARLTALVCARRKDCSFVKEHEAGTDARGRTLSAALFFMGVDKLDQSAEPEEQPAEDPDAATEPLEPSRVVGVTLYDDGEVFDSYSYDSCARYEYWRVVRDGEHIAEADRIAEICNGGHGVPGMDEDEVRVGPNSIQIKTSAGSSWRWDEDNTYSISPFLRRRSLTGGYSTMANNRETTTIDWERFAGGTSWYNQTCGPDGQLPDGDLPDGEPFEYTWIPSVPLDAAFLTGGWKTTRLDGCAASIDASGASGHLLSGKASTPADARVRVLRAETGALFVEVTDDTLTAGDHLEIWAAAVLPTFDSQCIDPADTKGVTSWNVAIADGKVTSGFGKPAAGTLTAERAAEASSVVRFQLGLPPALKAFTVVYADSDGAKVERRIATSTLDGGRVATLGTASSVGEHARCAVKNGALSPELRPEKISNPVINP